MINSTEIFEAQNEKDAIFLQVTTLLRFVSPSSSCNVYVDRYLSKEATIDDVCECLMIIIGSKSFVPMYEYVVASAVAMGYHDSEKYNKIKNAIAPIYWYYNITDAK